MVKISNTLKDFWKIKLLILDVDGVLTNGTKIYDSSGIATHKTFNDKDFTAIKQFRASGVEVVWLSGDKNVNEMVAKNRNIPFYYSRLENGNLNKAYFLEEFKTKYNCGLEEMAFIGDDYFDVEILEKVGFPFCPKDAINTVKTVVKKHNGILSNVGGSGIVAELYSWFLFFNGKEATNEDIMNLDKKEKF